VLLIGQAARRIFGEIFKDSLIEGITIDQVKQSGVASTYGHVIVGRGPGGLTLAMGLTENPNIHVAVVEKGTLPTSFLTYQLGELATSTFVDFTTVPTLLPSIDYIDITNPIKANGYSQHCPQGNMLRGSSSKGLQRMYRTAFLLQRFLTI
jgi:choline dehydrogenase-like flavoprotein